MGAAQARLGLASTPLHWIIGYALVSSGQVIAQHEVGDSTAHLHAAPLQLAQALGPPLLAVLQNERHSPSHENWAPLRLSLLNVAQPTRPTASPLAAPLLSNPAASPTTTPTNALTTVPTTKPTTTPITKPITTAAPIQIVARIRVNNIAQGDFLAYLTSDADFLMRPNDLTAVGILYTAGKSVNISGEDHVSLRSIPGLEIRFDEKTLTLELQAPAELLAAQSLNLGASLPATPIRQRAPGGFLNYRLGYAQSDGQKASWSANTELGVNIGELLLLNNHAFNTATDQARSVRLQTQLVFDQPDDMRRWIAGDSFASSGELGSSLNLGGIGISKLYQLNPYFIKTPLAGYVGSVAQASTVDIYVDGVRVRSEQLAPGNFNLQNLNASSGAGLRNVEVVVRDPFGREQRIGFPFFFTDQLLAEGLSEYSYNAGQMRNNFGLKSNDYGAFALSAFHRVGLSDTLTLGLGGDATRGHINIGPRVTFNTVQAGVISAVASFSRDRDAGNRNGIGSRSGSAVSFAHTFQAGAFSSQLLLRRYSEDYSVIGNVSSQRPKLQGTASVSYGSGIGGTGSLAYDINTAYNGSGDQRITTLGYSKTLLGNFSLVINVSRTERTERTGSGYGAFIGLSYYANNGVGVSASHHRSSGGSGLGNDRTDQLQVSKPPPIGEGAGYRLFAERSIISGAASESISPYMQYNTRAAILTAESTNIHHAGGGTVVFRQAAVASAVAVLGNSVYFSRPIDDSYAVARIEPALAGVRITKSSAEIGVTGAGGDVFIPSLGSYQVNDVGIQGKDLPIDYLAAHLVQRVRPPYRSGAVVVFPVTRVRAVTGSIKLRDGGSGAPVGTGGTVSALENATIVLDGVGGRVSLTLSTIRHGDFYLENLAPGTYVSRPQIGKRTCRLAFTVPDSREIVANLGDIYCEFIP